MQYVYVCNTYTPQSCHHLQPVVSLNFLPILKPNTLAYSLFWTASGNTFTVCLRSILTTSFHKMNAPRQAWQLKALHSQHSSKLVRVLFAFRLLCCVLCLCVYLCVCGATGALLTPICRAHFTFYLFRICCMPHTANANVAPSTGCPTERCSNDAHYAI